MSTLTQLTRPIRPVGTETIRPQRFSRLLSVEIRKMLDTRSGLAVLGLVLGVTVAGLIWMLARSGGADPSWGHYSSIIQATGMLLPVIGLLGMTAEWTQRTALTTFTLSPRRGRVLAAKFLGSVLLALAALAVVIVLITGTVLVGAAFSDQGASFAGIGEGIRSMLIITVLEVTMAAGLGALTAQTAVAVGAYFLAPTVVTVVGVQLLGENAKWLDVFQAYGRLSSSHPWADLPQTLTSVALWVLLPAVVGVVRSLKREVK